MEIKIASNALRAALRIANSNSKKTNEKLRKIFLSNGCLYAKTPYSIIKISGDVLEEETYRECFFSIISIEEAKKALLGVSKIKPCYVSVSVPTDIHEVPPPFETYLKKNEESGPVGVNLALLASLSTACIEVLPSAGCVPALTGGLLTTQGNWSPIFLEIEGHCDMPAPCDFKVTAVLMPMRT